MKGERSIDNNERLNSPVCLSRPSEILCRTNKNCSGCGRKTVLGKGMDRCWHLFALSMCMKGAIKMRRRKERKGKERKKISLEGFNYLTNPPGLCLPGYITEAFRCFYGQWILATVKPDRKKLAQVRPQNFSVEGKGYGPEVVHNICLILKIMF
jgi:hypothetical protein